MSFVDPDLIPSTGNPALDSHHRRIAGKVNGLFEGWQAGWPPKSLSTLLEEILGEIEDHFVAEKMLTRAAGYAGWEGHEPLHLELREAMEQIRGDVERPETHSHGMVDAFRFFEDLIFSHEFNDDQDFWSLFNMTVEEGVTILADWSPEHVVGRDDVDAQHAQLVTLVTAASRAAEAEDLSATHASLAELRQATKLHFEHEEDLMRTGDHPDLKEHMAAHRMLIRDLDEALRHCRSEDWEKLKVFLTKGLRFWFIDHVSIWDTRLGR